MNSFHASTPPTFRNIAKLKLQGNFVKKGLSYFPLIGGGAVRIFRTASAGCWDPGCRHVLAVSFNCSLVMPCLCNSRKRPVLILSLNKAHFEFSSEPARAGIKQPKGDGR